MDSFPAWRNSSNILNDIKDIDTYDKYSQPTKHAARHITSIH